MSLLDTNIFIRYIVEDDLKKTDRCQKLFEDVVSGKIELYVTDIAIAETIWVLESVYEFSHLKIRNLVEAILVTQNLRFQNKEMLEEAIFLYEKYNIDFIDGYHRAFMRQKGFSSIYSYDTDFDKIPEIERKEP